MACDIVGTRTVECVADVFYPLLRHTNTQDSDDENVTTRDNQRQQRIGAKQPHIQLTEKQLDKLLKLNDLYNAGVIGHTSEEDITLLRQFDDKEIANIYQQSVNPSQARAQNLYQPDLSSFVAGSENRSFPHSVLDYSDFGRSATQELLTDHADYALLDSSHSTDWDMYTSLSDTDTKPPRSDNK